MTSITGHVSGLYWCAVAGSSMQAANRLQVIAGKGIDGDRYATGQGTYTDTEPWQQASGLPTFTMAQTRRNILLNGIGAQALNSLVGQIFWVGHIQCRGTELCTPCPRPSQLSLQSGFQEAFDGRGGLRAEVLRGGEVAIGDVLRCE